ncbi:MAG: ceramidase domain-containing protein [Myxococcota bacterium]
MRVLRSGEVLTAVVSALVGVGSVVALGVLGWPGAPFDCAANPCYCELPGPGLVRQLGNTWSNLAAVTVGLLLAVHAARRRRSRLTRHRALEQLGLFAPPALVFQGVGSMYFHGGLTVWGSALDAMSMFAIAGLLVVFQAHRLGWVQPERVVPAWAAIVLGGLVVGFVSPSVVAGAVFALFLTILATEVLATRRGLSPRSGLFRLGISLHVTAVGVWFFSATDGQPLCAPSSPWQGHALWHVLTALSVGASVLHVMRNLELRERQRVETNASSASSSAALSPR